MFILRLTICLLVVLLPACGGLDPTVVPTFTGITGSIVYEGGTAAWPAPDSVIELRVVAFDKRPIDASEILGAVLAGKAVFSDTLPRFVDRTTFSIEVKNAPRTFEYVVVALRYGPDFTSNWRMLDVYSVTGDATQPSSVTLNVLDNKHIDFHVDFANLPPQPF